MSQKLGILLFILFGILPVYCQQSYFKEIHIENQSITKEEKTLRIQFDVNITRLEMERQHRIVLTPILKSMEGNTSLSLSPVIINGATRAKVWERKRVLNAKTVSNETSTNLVEKRKNGSKQIIPYKAIIPLESWMKKSGLFLMEEVTGCVDCNLGKNEISLVERIIEEPVIPSYKLTYITPEAEPVKARSAKHAAHFNYKVGRHELLPDFENNARELSQVDKVINEIKNDKDLTITDLTISGYASPEGGFSSNMALSQRRANTFADYLISKYGLSRNQLKINWHGEDWAGLEQAVKASNIADKDAILSIITSVSNPDARDAHLKKLSSGNTYQTLLNTYYPPLRRNEYTVSYVARAFDVEEAKEIIRVKPQLLSLNEMFLVAQTYNPGSKEFKEVFDIAVRLYPSDPIAIMNSAAADIEGGNNQAAIERLSKIEKDPRSWNNIGVAYARMGEFQKAQSYLQKAAKTDNSGKENLRQLMEYLNSK